jgi:hypothetical protein
MVTITEFHLEELKTPRGGYTNATLNALGVKTGHNKGWRQRLIGKTFTDEQYQQALDGRSKRADSTANQCSVEQLEKICINGKWYQLVEIV